jgi:hypothetical protein
MEYSQVTIGGDLRTQQFSQAISALPTDDVKTQVFGEQCKAAFLTASSSPALMATLTTLAGFAILMVIRPPFVLTVEQDASRPWKSKSSFNWLSAAACVALLVLAVMLIPTLLCGGGSKIIAPV